MNINSLKSELKTLGAKTTGSKKVLERRLSIWKEKGLNKTLYSTELVSVKPVEYFPEDRHFKPLKYFSGKKLLNLETIEKWFEKRKARKGKTKGRILAIKLFIKYTQIYFENNACYVRATCCAEQKKNAEYKIKVILYYSSRNNNFKLSHCTCSCPAGTGWSAACKHVGALCYSLEYFTITGKSQEYMSCTSEPLSWNKPTGRGVEYMSIFDITRKKKISYNVNEKYTNDTVNKLINSEINCPLTACRRVNMEDYLRDHTYAIENMKPQHSVEGSSIKNCNIQLRSSEAEEITLESELEYVNLNYIDLLEGIISFASNSKCINELEVKLPTQQCCKNIYDTLVPKNVLQLCINTKEDINKWHKERQFRVTGSRCYSLYTYKKDDWHVKSQKYFWPKAFTNRFMQYGIKTEPEARAVYKSRLNYEVVETGLIISERHPWLAYSPDGIIMKNGKPHKLLEIKCPVIGKEKSAINFFKHCDFLIIDNDRLTLKKKHTYYAQVQLGMSILNVKECDFIVYASYSKSFLNIVVDFDYEFVTILLKTLQHKYFNKMMHEICLNEN